MAGFVSRANPAGCFVCLLWRCSRSHLKSGISERVDAGTRVVLPVRGGGRDGYLHSWLKSP